MDFKAISKGLKGMEVGCRIGCKCVCSREFFFQCVRNIEQDLKYFEKTESNTVLFLHLSRLFLI